MSTELHITDPVRDARWDRFVEQHPAGTVYHLSRWKQLVEQTHGHRGCYATIEGPGTGIRAGLPCFRVRRPLGKDRLVCLPFADAADALYEDAADLRALLAALCRRVDEGDASTLELRTASPLSPDTLAGFSVNEAHVRHVIPLAGDLDTIRSRIHKNTRRHIRRAEQSRLRCVSANTEQGMAAFYRLYILTRRRQGLPPQPYAFFRNLHHAFHPPGILRVRLAMDGDHAIAGSVGLVFKKTFHALYGASETKSSPLRPNHLVTWAEIEEAHRLGLDLYDFGRTSAQHTTLLRFKEQWGALARPLYRYYLPPRSEGIPYRTPPRAASAARSLLVRLPIPILCAVGRLLYRYRA